MAKIFRILIQMFLLVVTVSNGIGQQQTIKIVTSDIDHFWEAYDKITVSKDSLERIKLINELYINRGSDGLKGLMAARDYKDYEYVEAILNYPKYWNSIRGNQQNMLKDAAVAEKYFQELKRIYPELKDATVYIPIGVFRSGGTYMNGNVLIGGEYFLANENAVIDELPERIQTAIKLSVPYNFPLTALHELIHTQQKPWENNTIVHICMAEGVAEFISTLIAKAPLSAPVKYGKENKEKVVKQFMKEVVRDSDVWNWVWNANQNELGVRDLGYYIGFEICEIYYNKATNKEQAIKDLIELDYNDEVAFAKMLDESKFLPLTWAQIGEQYEAQRPTVVDLGDLENGAQNVPRAMKYLTIEFSDEMSDCCRNLDIDENFDGEILRISKFLGRSDDKRKFNFELEPLKPNTRYHLIVSGFAKEDGLNQSIPYRIEFKTGQ